MGNVYTDIGAIQLAPTPATLSSPALDSGKIRVVEAVYEAASLAAASVIRICKLFLGEIVLLDSYIIVDALGSGTTIEVGDDDDTVAVDPNRYLEATSCSSAAVIQFNDVVTCIDKVPYKIAKAECWLGGTTADEMTGTLQFSMRIVRE